MDSSASTCYGTAVLIQHPEERFRALEGNDGKLLEVSSATLDVKRHTATVVRGVWLIDGSSEVKQEQEIHEMRFFFPQELAL